MYTHGHISSLVTSVSWFIDLLRLFSKILFVYFFDEIFKNLSGPYSTSSYYNLHDYGQVSLFYWPIIPNIGKITEKNITCSVQCLGNNGHPTKLWLLFFIIILFSIFLHRTAQNIPTKKMSPYGTAH